ncbi:MAG: septum formation inhibitor Maf [Gammaproteobacteria bacterium]|nr:MAG: septum formation inhibitor Maf [Gammaproteobacteria bacterium]
MSGTDAQIVLASASPRRAELLEQLRIRFLKLAPEVDESAHHGEQPLDLVRRLAVAKAAAVQQLLQSGLPGSGLPVLAADTLVIIDGLALGKPASRGDALAMLARLSDRAHQVLTAVAVAGPERIQSEVSRSTVRFRAISADAAARYWATGEPVDKAGSYAIQGIGAVFVDRLEGSYSGVMGLPLAETERLLSEAGVDCWRHRGPLD